MFWRIPIQCQMTGILTVSANSLELAMKMAPSEAQKKAYTISAEGIENCELDFSSFKVNSHFTQDDVRKYYNGKQQDGIRSFAFQYHHQGEAPFSHVSDFYKASSEDKARAIFLKDHPDITAGCIDAIGEAID